MNFKNDFPWFFSYDLSSLSNKQYFLEQGNQKYVFGVCTEPKEPCNGSAGACMVTGDKHGQSSSMGVVNTQLQLSNERNEAPYLLYESGSVCEALHKQWTTKIEFACQTDGMAAGPKIIENTNCTLIIQFITKLVCNNEVNNSMNIHFKGVHKQKLLFKTIIQFHLTNNLFFF